MAVVVAAPAAVVVALGCRGCLGVLRCFGSDGTWVMERWWCLEEWAARVVLGCCRGDGVKLFWMWWRWWVIVMRGGGGFGFLSRLKGRGT
jgi:hypothetical protein